MHHKRFGIIVCLFLISSSWCHLLCCGWGVWWAWQLQRCPALRWDWPTLPFARSSPPLTSTSTPRAPPSETCCGSSATLWRSRSPTAATSTRAPSWSTKGWSMCRSEPVCACVHVCVCVCCVCVCVCVCVLCVCVCVCVCV